MLLLALVLDAAPATEPGAVSIFRSACMNGTVTLKRGDVAQTGLSGMPNDARAALAQSQVEVGEVKTEPAVPTERQVPNTIYRILGEPETYLVLPASTPKPARYEALCAVVVKGNITSAAAKLFPDPSKVGSMFAVSQPSGASRDIPYMSAPIDSKMMVVARRKGWTLISAAPDERPARLRHP